MKKTIKFFGIIAIVVALGIGLSACGNAHAQQQQRGSTNVVERWEYKILRMETRAEVRLSNLDDGSVTTSFNALGNEGWQLVSVAPHGGPVQNLFVATFKRRLP